MHRPDAAGRNEPYPLQALSQDPRWLAALRACQAVSQCDRRQLAQRLLKLELLLPSLLRQDPAARRQGQAAQAALSALRRRRLQLWPAIAAPWQPLAEALARHSAGGQGIPGLWPDLLEQDHAATEAALRSHGNAQWTQLWQYGQSACRTARGAQRQELAQLSRQLAQIVADNTLAEDSALWADDAGLLLLWPFLPTLFQRCGWLDDQQQWRDEGCQAKAWRALSQLMGRSEDHDGGYSARLLVGLDADALVDAPPLGATEHAELDALVVAIEQRWAEGLPAMRLESGIRPLFMRRTGRWRQGLGCWQLHVELAAQDALLSRLAWPLGIVRLPWLDHLIDVNWHRPALPAPSPTLH
jgi:hypothetical protein